MVITYYPNRRQVSVNTNLYTPGISNFRNGYIRQYLTAEWPICSPMVPVNEGLTGFHLRMYKKSRDNTGALTLSRLLSSRLHVSAFL